MTKTGSLPNNTVCGFIGLGSQGAPIARRMIDAGFSTYLWARSPSTFDPFRDNSDYFCSTIEDLGTAAQHVGICVVNDADVKEVCGRLLPTMQAGSTVAIHSTVHPDTCRELAAEAGRFQVRLIDAPVSGGAPAAEAGKLTVMLGGDESTINDSMPVFSSFGSLIVRVGDVGAGQYVKLINNSLLVANIGLAQAALEAGEELGLSRDALVELLLASSGRSFGLEVRARMSDPAGFRHGGALLKKDLRLLNELLGDQSSSASHLSRAAEPFLNAAEATPEGKA